MGYFAKLSCAKSMSPNLCHQGYSTNFVNSTSYCGLPECSPNCPKWTSLQVAKCVGWFCSLSVFLAIIIIIIISCNSALYRRKQSYCASELHSYFWHRRHAFYKICGNFQKVISLRLTSLGTTVLHGGCWIGLWVGMKGNYEIIFYGENMNPSNPFPWVKLMNLYPLIQWITHVHYVQRQWCECFIDANWSN
jgi:hypothetical protein